MWICVCAYCMWVLGERVAGALNHGAISPIPQTGFCSSFVISYFVNLNKSLSFSKPSVASVELEMGILGTPSIQEC